MNPELVIQDFGGINNADLSKSGARITRGGSWKRQNIVVILPADEMIHAKVALALWSLIMPPNNGCVRILALGQEVGAAYSNAIEQVLAHPQLKDFQFILTVESDNLPPQDGVLKLLEALEDHKELSWVSGLYWTKGEGGCAQIWGDPNDPVLNFRPQVPKPECVQECVGTGQGFALYRMSLFKDERIEKPWFKTEKGPGGVSTQDLSFASKARKWGHRCAVDTRVRVGHLDTATGFVW
jgi:hypothetical protein